MSATDLLPVRIIQATPEGLLEIPAEFRSAIGIEADTRVLLTLRDGALHLTPIPQGDRGGSPWLRELHAYFEPWRREADEKGYTDEQINEWIDDALEASRRERDG